MRVAFVVFSLVLVALASVRSQEEPQVAPPCDPQACQLPNCRCSSTSIPGGLQPRDTPQFVILAFDDGVTVSNIEIYRTLIYNRLNKNNCTAKATFFVNHEYTNYMLVNELFNRNHEIALHSITHRTPEDWWSSAPYETLLREFADQKTQMSHFANIPITSINGIRSPFLRLSGNATFQMLQSANLRYDLSWPTIANVNPGLWPYTLHYASTQDCIIPPCPNESIPGPWVIPIVTLADLAGFRCSFIDACFGNPGNDEEGWFRFLLDNFERHYMNNRAPFNINIHAWFIDVNPAFRSAFTRFLNVLNNLNDVFMVSANEVIDWVQNPVPINEYVQQPCRSNPQAACNPNNCGPLTNEETGTVYWMGICNSCPRTYPWINNPLGQ